jgi:pimeloyl-ACP methyl ester carboxylesterase
MNEPFVLIHGSWHGGWAWQAVIRQLAMRGWRAYAPTLPGHGPDAERTGITHRGCVDSVVAFIRQRDLRDVILVGHSFGGSVIQKVAEALPERIQRLIFLDAFVLEDGQCIFDNLPHDMVVAFNQMAAASADNTMLLPWEIWRDRFIQDAPEAVARAIWELLSPEPNQVNLERLALKCFYALETKRSYVVCRQDLSLPPGTFHPGMSARLGTFDLVEVDGSHEVMFTRPAELADKLIAASAK